VVLGPKSWKSEKKKLKIVKEPKNQILCCEIEPNPSKDRAIHEVDNISLEMNLYNLLFA
jgi:hypothetical protein